MDLTNEIKLEMFWTMLLARRLDERAWMLHRQGRIDFHISGIGQEAAQVGAAFALRRGYDWIAPYYRDLALMIAVGYTPQDFALSMMGKREEPGSGGRQMPSHWGLVRQMSSAILRQSPHSVSMQPVWGWRSKCVRKTRWYSHRWEKDPLRRGNGMRRSTGRLSTSCL